MRLAPSQLGGTVFRYNVRILLSNSWWLLVVPFAAAQLMLLWNMALLSSFTVSTAAQTTEVLAPLLAAFLCAHLFGTEYRFRADEISFCKPFAAQRVLRLRLILLLGFLTLLIVLVLAAYYLWLQPFNFLLVLAVGIPSTLFLATLAMLTTALVRNPLLGFFLTALLWALDAWGGVEFNPVLTLQGYTAYTREMTNVALGLVLARHWWVGKIILLALSALFYRAHARIVFQPPSPRQGRQRWRRLAICAAALVGYLYSGAAYKVWFGRTVFERAVPGRTHLWFRERFSVYGPLPVAWAFGPAFVHYLGAPSEKGEVSSSEPQASRNLPLEIKQMRAVAERYPRSPWADHALFELGRLYTLAGYRQEASARGAMADRLPAPGNQEDDVMRSDNALRLLREAVRVYRQLAEGHPQSVFLPLSLDRMSVVARQSSQEAERRWACQRLMERHPDTPQAWNAAKRLLRDAQARGRAGEAIAVMERAARYGAVYVKPEALLNAAHLLAASGRQEEAQGRYRAALQAADACAAALQRNEVDIGPYGLRQLHLTLGKVRREAKAALGEK